MDSYLITKDELFQQQAPAFNFELNADELLEKALASGYVECTGKEGLYAVNSNYGG